MDVRPVPPPPLDIEVLVRRTTSLLHAGVPLSLLLDLADERGPHSVEHYAAEGGSADWLPLPR